ncbi:hypothetical protein C9I36_05645, partial [Pectobacterium punjabense]
LHVRWLRSVTRITYLSKLIGIPSLAAFLKLELFRVYIMNCWCYRLDGRRFWPHNGCGGEVNAAQRDQINFPLG